MYKMLILMSVFTAIFSRKKTDEELLVILSNPSHSLYDKTLNEFYRLKRKQLIAYIEKQIYCDCGDKDEVAKDIFQDTMVEFLIKVAEGKVDLAKGSIDALLYGIAYNKALAFCYKLKTTPLTNNDINNLPEPYIINMDIENLLAIAQKENFITQLQEDVYMLHTIDKKTHEIIAKKLGISVDMSRQHKTKVHSVLSYLYIRDNCMLSPLELAVWVQDNRKKQSLSKIAKDLTKTEIEALLATANEKIKAFLSEELTSL